MSLIQAIFGCCLGHQDTEVSLLFSLSPLPTPLTPLSLPRCRMTNGPISSCTTPSQSTSPSKSRALERPLTSRNRVQSACATRRPDDRAAARPKERPPPHPQRRHRVSPQSLTLTPLADAALCPKPDAS